jgi:hypothetical protein
MSLKNLGFFSYPYRPLDVEHPHSSPPSEWTTLFPFGPFFIRIAGRTPVLIALVLTPFRNTHTFCTSYCCREDCSTEDRSQVPYSTCQPVLARLLQISSSDLPLRKQPGKPDNSTRPIRPIFASRHSRTSLSRTALTPKKKWSSKCRESSPSFLFRQTPSRG